MIKKIFANKSSFKTVEFRPGMNIVWADRTKDSTKKDSRNGLGKTTLIEIIHFCLGAKTSKGKGLLNNNLDGWEFSLVMQIEDKNITITRSVDHPNIIRVDGDVQKNQDTLNIKAWNALLGHLLFGLETSEEQKYQPTFRSLISYFIRRSKDAFSTPFEHHRKQIEWDKQVNNVFLLGLAWEDAASFQILKDRKKGLEEFKKAVKSGVVKGIDGSLGDLEAQKVRLKTKADKESLSLQSFKVLPQYEQIQAEANELTQVIHKLINANTIDKRLLSLYEQNLTEETPPESDTVEQMYTEAGIALPNFTLRRLEEVQVFHKKIIANRRAFLSTEIDRLKREIGKRDIQISEYTEKKASTLEILKTHGALEEYTSLQKKYLNTINDLNSISTMIENMKAFDSGLSDIKISHEEILRKARQDYAERTPIRERAISLFNTFSESLYSAPGKLVIDVEPTGFRFDVEIERSGSSGISNMKIFCYDLTLAKLWADKSPSPRLLIHDSTIFDGVDERQRALALEIAAKESEQSNFQYICMLNSDNVPWDEFSRDFDLKKYIILTLSDQSLEGCLLGIRF